MSLNEHNTVNRITMPIIQRDINSDVCDDFTLPEYCPEIRKVLCVRHSLLPPAKFVSGNKIDINGVVDYDLIYVSVDGRLCSAPFSSEYDISLPLENMSAFEISEGFCATAHTVPEGSAVRVSSPRRLQIRSHLRTAVGVWGKMLCCEKIYGLEDGDESLELERLEGNIDTLELLCESSDVISVHDEYQLDSEDRRIATAEGGVTIKSVRVDDDTVRIGGEISVKLVTEKGEVCDRVVRKIPFDAQTDLDGMDICDAPLCRVSGSVTDISVEVADGVANIDVNVVIEACVASKKSVGCVRDAYSTQRECKCNTRRYEIPVIICNMNADLSQSERVKNEEFGIPNGAEIVDVSASATVDKAEAGENGYTIHGLCKYSMILKSDGEYMSGEVRLPFRYDIEGKDGIGEINAFDVLANVYNVRVRCDGESLNVDSEISLGCSMWGSRSVDMLESIELSAPTERRTGAIIVYYPQADDTVWSIAKKYSVPQSDISGDPQSDPFVMIEL